MCQLCADARIGGESYVRQPRSSLGGECQGTTNMSSLACSSGMFSAPFVPPLLPLFSVLRMCIILAAYWLMVLARSSKTNPKEFGEQIGLVVFWRFEFERMRDAGY